MFGKNCENLKNRIYLKLTTDNEKAVLWFSKLQVKGRKCIDGLHMIKTFKQDMIYDIPSYLGTSVLDLTKQFMMQFHVDVIHANVKGNYNLI